MEHDLDSSQARAVLDFMLFLNDTLSRTSQHFEDETLCSPEEANVISLLSRRGPLMVEEIAQAMPAMGPSKLTRLLYSLEKQDYAMRTLIQTNRRRFLLIATGRGRQLPARFTAHLREFG